ncbi:cytochrome c [uncultured Tateyamaria sp.]|uniref:c-type cytochrome n=1 Tax=uncultured Tateyamaria sp. TaxID=455651 RepID=UPI00261190E4|nr:cytochrome c [uncultured Tateyamaria sp.]
MKHLLAGILAALGLAGAATAEDAQNGEALFQSHCAVCHGLGARGDGPMATVLLIKPPDLTQLTARNGGVYPIARIVMRIDGRDPLVSHGSPMPVYGPFFDVDFVPLKAETGQPIMTSTPVSDLLAYLRGVQE